MKTRANWALALLLLGFAAIAWATPATQTVGPWDITFFNNGDEYAGNGSAGAKDWEQEEMAAVAAMLGVWDAHIGNSWPTRQIKLGMMWSANVGLANSEDQITGDQSRAWTAAEYLWREHNWMQLMEQLRPLAEMTKEEIPADASVPDVPCWSLTPAMRQKIVERLAPPRRWLDVALTSLEDLPVFYYRPKEGDRIRFENASAGQQATALLKVLLKETTGPLLIDQPEDDLDNATIQQIAEEIWASKERRQIIFSSHSANIVVNGDAELVIHCDYRAEAGGTKGHVAGEGAIDIPKIRDAIKLVMEGGDKAFHLRRQKYGF